RALLESDAHASSFLIRNEAKSVPLIANIGAVQFNYGYGPEECQRIVEKTDADALVLHLNSLQEVVQDGGDLNFENLLLTIEKLCKQLNVPVGAKEVGFGIEGTVAKKLYDCGVSCDDVAGPYGTLWCYMHEV